MRSIVTVAICMIFLTANSVAQDGEFEYLILSNGAKAHTGIDASYKEFSVGYVTLDAAKVAGLYTKDASYLTPNRSITSGRDAIYESFSSFFNGLRERGEKVTISFEVVQRRVEGKMAFDVGIYTVSYYKGEEKLRDSKGKFVVVAVVEKDGKWRFQVDGYSGLGPEDGS